MNTIEKLGDEETFRQIVERSITSFIDDELTALSRYAFYGCKELQEVSLPLVTELPEQAFRGCSKLTTFNFSKITKIGSYVFQSCGFTEVNGPLVASIADNAFSLCSSLTSVAFPKATSIGVSAFSMCSYLSSAEFPEATSIQTQAFSECSGLTKAKFPKATSIGSDAFYRCSSLSSLIVGTGLNDETAICTLSSTNALPSSIGAIYVPYNLVEKYKTATNWSSFASKIQAYDVPVSCQSLTITAEDVPWYETSTKIHYEAVCTYSIGGMLQTGTKVFKGDVTSDTFEKNPSSDSSRSIEVSYSFLGQTATTTLTQDKYRTDLVGGTIFYIDSSADGVYEFYDIKGELISNVARGDKPYRYKVISAGSKDKYYIRYYEENPKVGRWTYYKDGSYVKTNLGTGTAIGTGKSNTATVMAADNGAYVTADSNGYPTIWYLLQLARDAASGGCNDWFIPSKDELGWTLKQGDLLWSSSEDSSNQAWYWYNIYWPVTSKEGTGSVAFVRAF